MTAANKKSAGRWGFKWYLIVAALFVGGVVSYFIVRPRFSGDEVAIVIESSVANGSGAEVICHVSAAEIDRQKLTREQVKSEVLWQLNSVGIAMDAVIAEVTRPDVSRKEIERVMNERVKPVRPPGSSNIQELQVILEIRRIADGVLVESSRTAMTIGGRNPNEIRLN